MRLLFTALLVWLVLGMGIAWAANAYNDVPADHWAYSALDYLAQYGVLEGYPDGFFKGDRTLTRYEFAQAVARLLNTTDSSVYDEQIAIIANTLRAEFADQLAALDKQLIQISSEVSELDGRVGGLEAKVDDNASKVSDLAGKIAGMKTGPDWKGSLRYRWQFDSWGNAPGEHNLFRQRIAFQLGLNTKVDEAVEMGFRLKTQVGVNPPTSNVTLGNNLKAANIYLERAYIKYTPSWFGYYTDKDCNPVLPRMDIYAGIFPNIAYDPHEMLMNAGENLQGLGVVYHFNQDFQILTAASIAMTDPAAEDYFNNDSYMFATEAKYNNLLLCGLDAWIGCYGWQNEERLDLGLFDGNRLRSGNTAVDDFNGDGVVDGSDRFSPNFNTVKGGLQYTFNCVFDKPLALFGEYMVNVDSTAEEKIRAFNTAMGANLIYESTDDTGFNFGATLGKEPVAKGEWYAFAQYKEVGANAVLSGFGDADAGLANRNSLKVHWEYLWAQNSLLGITYFLTKMNNAFGGPVINDLADRSLVQVDWTFKF